MTKEQMMDALADIQMIASFDLEKPLYKEVLADKLRLIRERLDEMAELGSTQTNRDLHIMWKLSQQDTTRITCDCGRPARFGRTVNGGAPFIYECSKHIPVGVPVTIVR